MEVEDDILKAARARLAVEAAAVHAVAATLDRTFVTAASMTLVCRGQLSVGGSGTSGTVAPRMAHILSVTGRPAITFSSMDSLSESSGAIIGAVVVLLTVAGVTRQWAPAVTSKTEPVTDRDDVWTRYLRVAELQVERSLWPARRRPDGSPQRLSRGADAHVDRKPDPTQEAGVTR